MLSHLQLFCHPHPSSPADSCSPAYLLLRPTTPVSSICNPFFTQQLGKSFKTKVMSLLSLNPFHNFQWPGIKSTLLVNPMISLCGLAPASPSHTTLQPHSLFCLRAFEHAISPFPEHPSASLCGWLLLIFGLQLKCYILRKAFLDLISLFK